MTMTSKRGLCVCLLVVILTICCVNVHCSIMDQEAFDDLGSCYTAQLDVVPDANKNTASEIEWTKPTSNTTSSVTCDPNPDTVEFAGGNTLVTCTVWLNSTLDVQRTCNFTVRVSPTFNVSCPSDITVAPTNEDGTAVVYWAQPVGNEDTTGEAAEVICDVLSGSTFTRNETTVTCTATDAGTKGNTSCTLEVIIDSVAPEITCPTNWTVNITGGLNTAIYNWSAPSATDNWSSQDGLFVSCIPPSGADFLYGKTHVLCFAIDSVNNVGICSFEVEVTSAECDAGCSNTSFCTLDDNGDRLCECLQGYVHQAGSNACTDVDECANEVPCHPNAICTNETPLYNCHCDEENKFYGDGVYSCERYIPAEYPVPNISTPLQKSFHVELSIANSSMSSCNPLSDEDKMSPACIALITAFKNLIQPLYEQVSISFQEVVVVQTDIKKGSVVIPHTIHYDYATASSDVRGLRTEAFYANSIRTAVEAGYIGSLKLLEYFAVNQTTDFCSPDNKLAMTCKDTFAVYEDRSNGGCLLMCASPCQGEFNYCNGGNCAHNEKGTICSECPENTDGMRCEEVIDFGPNIPLIVGLSVGLGGTALLVVVAIIVYFACIKDRSSKVTNSQSREDEGGLSNEALAMSTREM